MIQTLAFYLTDGETDIDQKRFEGTKEQMLVSLKALQMNFCIQEAPTIYEQKTKLKGKWVLRISAQSNSRYSWYFYWPVKVDKPDFKNITL